MAAEPARGQPNNSDLESLLEKAPSLIAEGAAMIAVLGAIAVQGIKLRSGLPIYEYMSPGDFLRMALEFVVATGVGLLIGIYLAFLNSAGEGEYRSLSVEQTLLRLRIIMVILALIPAVMLPWLLFSASPAPFGFLGLAGAIVWFCVVDGKIRSSHNLRWTPIAVPVLYFFPMLMSIAFCNGLSRVERCVKTEPTKSISRILLTDNSERSGRVLLALENYLIFFEPLSHQFVALQASQIRAIDVPSVYSPSKAPLPATPAKSRPRGWGPALF